MPERGIAAGFPDRDITFIIPNQVGGGFEVTTANGEQVRARKVVVAIGVEAFAYVPQTLSALPASAVTHSSAHTDLSVFRDQEVVVTVPYDRGDLISRAHQEGEVLCVQHGQDGTELTARVPPGLAAELERFAAQPASR